MVKCTKKSLINWILERTWDWEEISNYGKNKFVTRTYIFLFILPFIVRTLEKYDFEEIIESIPFSWHVFFYSAVFFTIGTLLYRWKAPKIIRENKSFADFLNNGYGWQRIEEYYFDIGLDLEEEELAIDQFIKEHQNVNRDQLNDEENYKTFLENVDIDEEKKEMFLTIFRFRNNQIGTIAPWQVNTGFNSERTTNSEVQYETLIQYHEQKRKNEQKNIKTVFFNLWKYSRIKYGLARFFCTVLFLIGTVGIIGITVHSIITVIEVYGFEFLKRLLMF